MNRSSFTRSLSFIRSWLRLRTQYADIPGLVIAVERNGRLEFNEAYGSANLETCEPLRPDHNFRVASHSKMFTATGIMKLVEKSAVNLDDKVDRHLPWLRKHQDRRMRSVTIRQILSHSAGLVRDGLEANYWLLTSPFPDRSRLRDFVMASDLIFDTNVRMKYSNIGYSLLGLLIEAASGRTYGDFIKREIIDPLGLNDTTEDLPKNENTRLVTGYTRPDFSGKRRPIPHVSTNSMASATGVCSTASDLLRFMRAHTPGCNLVLSDESKKEMQRVHSEVLLSEGKRHYGLGFMLERNRDRAIIGHSGGFAGQRTRTFLDRNDRIAVSILSNAVDCGTDAILDGIFQVFDFFRHNEGQTAHDPSFEGQFFSIFGITQAVSVSEGFIVCLNPNSWSPFSSAEELRRVKKNVFVIEKADSYLSPGEEVRFFFRKGKVFRVRYAGADMYPENEYRKRVEKLSGSNTSKKG